MKRHPTPAAPAFFSFPGKVMRFLILATLAAALVAVGSISLAKDAPLVAIPPAVLLSPAALEKTTATLSELVQLSLQSTPDHAAIRFVERTSLDTLLREQTLAISSSSDATSSSLRTGRLLHADWTLLLRLHRDDHARLRLEAEVIDTLRADLLACAENSFENAPDESWTLAPSPAVVRIATTTASRALTAAIARASSLAHRSTLAPLVFINRSGTDRLAPLAPKFLAALRVDHPATHTLGYDAPGIAAGESALYLAGLTDLAPETWARLADAYLWGEFTEDPAYIGPVTDTPVTLTLHLWREGDSPSALSFVGTLGDLDALAHRAASATLDATAGALLVPTVSARRASTDRLLAAAAALFGEPQTTHLDRKETPQSRLARLTGYAQLLGLASFFSPEDASLHEQHINSRLRLVGLSPARLPWLDAFWLHFDQQVFTADSTPDLALIDRAIIGGDIYYDYSRPGYAARTLRLGPALQKHPPTAAVVTALWEKFLRASYQLPDEPGLPAALESIWPLVRRVQPDLADFTIRSDMMLRETLSRIYRPNPARLRLLLTDKLFPLDFTPLPVAPASATQSPHPPLRRFAAPAAAPAAASAQQGPAPSLAANPFIAWQKIPPETLLARARTGPFATLPQLAAPVSTITLQKLPYQAFLADFTTDGRVLWLAFSSLGTTDATGQDHRAARLDLATSKLTWPPALARSPFPVSSLWAESSNELWLTTRGTGLRILRPAPAQPIVLDASHGLPHDDIPCLRRGHDALFLAPQTVNDTEPVVTSVSAITLHDHAIVIRPAYSTPDLAPLPAATRAAIASFPADTPPRVRLPDDPAIAFSPAGPPPPNPAYERLPPALRAKTSPFGISFSLAGTGLPNDPAIPRLALITGPRDGYWIASERTLLWAAGPHRHPIAHWLQGSIVALADDGRHLFVLVTGVTSHEWARSHSRPITPDTTRLYAYDHAEGRWLGWLALPDEGALTAGGHRLVIARSPSKPIIILDTEVLRPFSPSPAETSTSTTRQEVVPDPALSSTLDKKATTPKTSRARRLERDEYIRRHDALITAILTPPTELSLLTSALDAEPNLRIGDLLKNAIYAKNYPAFELLLARLPRSELTQDSSSPALGLFLTHSLLFARRTDLARHIVIKLGYRPTPEQTKAFPDLGHLALRTGDLDLIQALYAAGFSLEGDVPPLLEAVAQQNLPLLRYLLATPLPDGSKRHPDDSTRNGLPPLFAAADAGWTEGVRTLLEAGATDFCPDHATGRSLNDAAAPWPEIVSLLQSARLARPTIE